MGACPRSAQLFHQGEEPGAAAERIEIAVVLEPRFIDKAVGHGPFQAIERLVDLAGEVQGLYLL